jgi:hypothetical protein
MKYYIYRRTTYAVGYIGNTNKRGVRRIMVRLNRKQEEFDYTEMPSYVYLG